MIKMVENKIKECESTLADPSETDRSYYEGNLNALKWVLNELLAEG